MNSQYPKKWSSLEDMKSDLQKGDCFLINSLPQKTRKNFSALCLEIDEIVNAVRVAEKTKDFVTIVDHLLNILRELDVDSFKGIVNQKNFYILFFSTVFQNENFRKALIEVVADKDEAGDRSELDKKSTFINHGILLAFIPLSFYLPLLSDENIIFLRKHITDNIKFILRGYGDKVSFSNFCFELESILRNYKNLGIGKDENIELARSIAGTCFLALTINPALSQQLKNIAKRNDGTDFNLIKEFATLYGLIHKFEESEKGYCRNINKSNTILLQNFFEVFIRNNERNLLFFIKNICSGFHPNAKFGTAILAKINGSAPIGDELLNFAKVHLNAFCGEMGEIKHEWSNKIFIASIRTLSVLSAISGAKDNKWKISAAVFELRRWINDVHEIFNRNLIEDDWHLISDVLAQENVEVEWKSTFYTPLEQHFVNTEADIGNGKKIFAKIVQTILAMMNTNGGVVLVGIVENPDLIVRKEHFDKIIHKNGKTFFNIEHELKNLGKTLDHVRLHILEQLQSITDCSSEKFNDLIFLEPVIIRKEDAFSVIVKITINKGEKLFFNINSENKGGKKAMVWASLIKRANGQNTDVDIRDYI